MKNEYKTKSRTLIIDYLKNHSDQRFTARDIYKKLNEDDASINRATVYRNLERLCKQGKLVKYKDANADACFFRYSDQHEHCNQHMHAQCSNCGKILHLENEFVDDFENQIHSIYGIDIDFQKTIIFGTCDKCKNTNCKNDKN